MHLRNHMEKKKMRRYPHFSGVCASRKKMKGRAGHKYRHFHRLYAV